MITHLGICLKLCEGLFLEVWSTPQSRSTLVTDHLRHRLTSSTLRRWCGLQSRDRYDDAGSNRTGIRAGGRESAEMMDNCAPNVQRQCVTSCSSHDSQNDLTATCRHNPPELPSRNTPLLTKQTRLQDSHSSLSDSVSTLSSKGDDISNGDTGYDVSVFRDELNLYECICKFSVTDSPRQSPQCIQAYLTPCNWECDVGPSSYDRLSFDGPPQGSRSKSGFPVTGKSSIIK